jgi:hypothetical protein
LLRDYRADVLAQRKQEHPTSTLDLKKPEPAKQRDRSAEKAGIPVVLTGEAAQAAVESK